MVCVRCKMAVEAVLKANGVPWQSVVLGRAQLVEDLTPAQKIKIAQDLRDYELELMEDRNKILVERIKTEILGLLQEPQALPLKLSVHLSAVLGYHYTYLTNTFSEQEGMTLERFFISQRVERVKELIVYEEASLARIAEELQFSSVSHLCLQFKKVTGLTPAEFRKRCRMEDFIWRKV